MAPVAAPDAGEPAAKGERHAPAVADAACVDAPSAHDVGDLLERELAPREAERGHRVEAALVHELRAARVELVEAHAVRQRDGPGEGALQRADVGAAAEVAAEVAGRAQVYKLDIDQSPDIAQRYGVMSVPTLIAFQGGQIKKQAIGVQPKQVLLDMLS